MLNVERLLEELNEVQIDNDELSHENKHLLHELEECEKALDSLQFQFDEYRKLSRGTRCHFCNTKLIWNSDFSFEDYGISEEEGIVAYLTCPNCDTYAEFYHTIGEVEW